MKIKVLLADDHAVVRDGIKSIVEKKADDILVTGEARNGKEVLMLARQCPADVYVLDIAMPVLNGMETAERLLKLDKRNRIIFLSMYDTRAFVEQALKLGVKSYLLKESATEEIITAIRETHANRRYLSPRISKYLAQGHLFPHSVTNQGLVRLTPREREVLQLISEGNSNKDIARAFGRSINTIHVHRNSIMQKLDMHNQSELVRYAFREGITQL